MNLPENDHFTATSGNVTEDNIKIHLRKLGFKEEMLVKEVEDSVQWRVLVLAVLNYRILLRKFNYIVFVVREVEWQTATSDNCGLSQISLCMTKPTLHWTYSIRLTITVTQMTSRLKKIPRAQINTLTRQVTVHILWLSSAGNESPRNYCLSGHLSAGSSYLMIRAVWLATAKNTFPYSSKQTPSSKVLLKLGINMPTDLQIAGQSCRGRLDRTRTTSNQLASLNRRLELFISLIGWAVVSWVAALWIGRPHVHHRIEWLNG